MTETSRFWDGTSTGDASTAPYDAATEFSKVLATILGHLAITNAGGVLVGQLNELAPSGVATPVAINSGRAVVRGTYYENTASVSVTIPTPGGATRIDRIVLRKDWTAQTVRITRIAGVEGGGAPALTQTEGTTWDVPICQASITVGGVITITDERDFMLGNSMLGRDVPRANLLVNGGFEVWQRGAGAFTVHNAYIADRWLVNIAGTDTFSITRDSTDEDSSSTYCAAAVFVLGTGAGGSYVYQQLVHTDWNAELKSRTVSVSVRVKTSTPNAVRIGISDAGVGVTYSAYHSGNGAYETLTVTKAIGAAGTGVAVQIYFAASCTAYLDNAMLVIGSVPVDYVPQTPAEEMDRCQRYYIDFPAHGSNGNAILLMDGYTDAVAHTPMRTVFFPTTMYTNPTVTKYGTWSVSRCDQPAVNSVRPWGFSWFVTTDGSAGWFEAQKSGTDDGFTVEANP